MAEPPPTAADGRPASPPALLPPSKTAQKKLLKRERHAARKAERKAQEKARRREDGERKRREWEEKLAAAASEEERARMVESRKETRRERMEQRSEERGLKVDRLRRAVDVGQKIVIDLEFTDLMTPTEIHSLVQQVWITQLSLLLNCLGQERFNLLLSWWFSLVEFMIYSVGLVVYRTFWQRLYCIFFIRISL